MSAMQATELAQILGGNLIAGEPHSTFDHIVYDSRKVRPNALFVALRGEHSDGHKFASAAAESGASVLLVEEPVSVQTAAAVIQVPDTVAALADTAAGFYNYPSRDLDVYAVTGTNGKTSTAHLVQSILSAAGVKCGLVGTLGARVGDQWLPIAHTTPFASDLQSIFAGMRDAGVGSVVMEASSHAIHQQRMRCTDVDTAIFTNLTQDHLDFHGTMEDYFQVKARLFTDFAAGREDHFLSVINIDDPTGRECLLPMAKGRVVTYGTASDSTYHASDPRSGPNGTCFHLRCPEGETKITLALGGLFNVHNALAAAAACLARGIPLDAVAQGLQSLSSVPGRFELVDCGQPFSVVVDYAHTPDGLDNVLQSAREFTPGRLITIFGCGGDRDRAKRPVMGEIASRLSDIAILTSDNPRTEDPAAIAADALEGVPDHRRDSVIVQLDRREAILRACSMAGEGDVVAVTGKGHETYQIFADRTINFDDRAVVREVLQELGLCRKGVPTA